MNLWTINITFIFLFSFVIIAFSQDNEENESGESILEREKYIYERRAGGPGKIIPPDAYEKALLQKKLIPEDKNSNSLTSTTSWVSVNPAGMFYAITNNNFVSGRTNSIAFDPVDPNTIYIGAAQGGVWKTIDNGAHWFVLNDNFGSLASGDIEIDPHDSHILYYGTGELNFSIDSHYGDGIYKSYDAGSSWTKIVSSSIVGSHISKIIIDPTPTTNTVYSSGITGVFKSVNGGTVWSNILMSNITSLIMNKNNPQILFAGSITGQIYKTINGGTLWTLMTVGLPTSGGRVQLAISPDNPNFVYASIANTDGSLLGLYRTIDGGSVWTLQNSSTNYLSYQGWYDNAITIVPGDPDKVVVGGIDIFFSDDGGVTLTRKTSWFTASSTNFSHADIHYLGYNGSVLFCGSDGGVYKSYDNGNTWNDLNATLSTLQYQSADYDPTNTQLLYGGCQDNDKQKSINNGLEWIQTTTGDGGYTVVDPITPNFIYGQYVIIQPNKVVQRSSNYGLGYIDIGPFGSWNESGLFYSPYELAPSNHNVLVYGKDGVWKTDYAQSATEFSGWTQIASTSETYGDVSAIGVATDVNKIYIGTSYGQILVTLNNGATWSSPSTTFQYVTDFFVDPANDNICYATFGGTSGTNVFKTIDYGTTWNNISNNLPHIAANTITVKTSPPRMIFVGTDLGVFQSIDDGATWGSFSTGFPNVQVYDLKYKEGPKILLAATHGRGCFTFDLNLCSGPDLWMRDYTDDLGIEPNGGDFRTWISKDIWVRNSNDGFTHPDHENVEFSLTNQNYVYVKVKNRGCESSLGSERLNVHWSKAATSQSWPDNWDGSQVFVSGSCTPLKGNTIPSPAIGNIRVYKNSTITNTPSNGGFITIPVINPGQEAIFEIPWFSPNPSDYACLSPLLSDNPGHFCLVARIETSTIYPYGITYFETSSLYDNVIKNNNIISKNIEVVNLVPGSPGKIGFLIGNASYIPDIKKIQFNASASNSIYNKAEVKAKLSSQLYQIWLAGGKQGSNFVELSDSSIKFLTNGAYISNLFLDSNKFYPISLELNPLSVPLDSLPLQPEYILDVNQFTGSQYNTEGGIRFSVQLPPDVPTLNLKMYIQGFYNATSNTMIEDTTIVYIRNISSPYLLVDSAKAKINSDGTATVVFSLPEESVDYYIQLKHRNSIETWSASTGVRFTSKLASYDFSTALNRAFGNNMKQIDVSPVRFAIYSGDVSQDGSVDGTDKLLINNDAFNFVNGYIATDVDGNDFVDGSDAVIVDNNAFNFVNKITP